MPGVLTKPISQEYHQNKEVQGISGAQVPNEIGITLFRFQDMEGWQAKLVDALQKLGFNTYLKRNAVWAWENGKVVAGKNGQPSIAYGCEFTREPLSGDEPCLAIRAKEVYLKNGEVIHLSPEQRKPVPGPTQEFRIEYCLKLGERLAARIDGLEAEPVQVKSENQRVHQQTGLVLKNHKEDRSIERPWNGLRQAGFNHVPKGFSVIVFLKDPKDVRAENYINCLRVAFRSYGEVVDFTTRLFTDCNEIPCGAVGLVGLQGCKGEILDADELKLLESLDAKNAKYRTFSLANQDMKWSAYDQAASLLYTAGGVPYALDLPWPAAVQNTYSIGVDLGHPMGAEKSILAISLIDPQGIHIKSWRYEQARSENADLVALQSGLRKARELVEKLTGQKKNNFLVVRDGRRNKSERVGHYREVLGQAMTFVDLSKRSSCHMFARSARPKSAEAGTVLFVGKKNTPFILPIVPSFHQQMINPQKVIMRKEWDGLELGIERVCALLTGMCYAPSLGMKPHRSPAPIYWANGIASIKPHNCQFRGQQFSDENSSDLKITK